MENWNLKFLFFKREYLKHTFTFFYNVLSPKFDQRERYDCRSTIGINILHVDYTDVGGVCLYLNNEMQSLSRDFCFIRGDKELRLNIEQVQLAFAEWAVVHGSNNYEPYCVEVPDLVQEEIINQFLNLEKSEGKQLWDIYVAKKLFVNNIDISKLSQLFDEILMGLVDEYCSYV